MRVTLMKNKRSYSELCLLTSFEDRFNYLKLDGRVGDNTFGSRRYLNQAFYTSREWQSLRRKVILRDLGCDLGVLGFEYGPKTLIVLHHIEPITVDDVIQHSDSMMDPDNLISCSLLTHNAIHYGSIDMLRPSFSTRSPNDTCPWRK